MQEVVGSTPISSTISFEFFIAYYVYILYSLKLDKYIGSTQDVFTRLDNHNAGKSISTKAGAPWSLKYTEEFVTRSEAVKRE